MHTFARPTLGLVVATALAVMVTLSPVAAAPPAAPPAEPPAAERDRHQPPRLSRDHTLDLRDAFVATQHLRDVSGETQHAPVSGRVAAEVRASVAARPSDPPDGSGEARWDPAAPRDRLCGATVCVHYVTSTSDAPPLAAADGTTPDWVRRNLAVAELTLHRVFELGYPAPPPDKGKGDTDQFDVYLVDISRAGLYGYCAPEALVPGAPGHASSYCVFDNDFAGFPMPPDESLRVTAAHELFHAVQFGMDVNEDHWFLESTATWMEEQVADDVNDNRQFLPSGQLARRSVPLDLAANDLGTYGNWIFFQFLAQRFGVDAVRQIWARADAGPGRRDDFSVEAVRRFVNSRGGRMSRLYPAFAAANLVPQRSYDEGANYGRAGFDTSIRLGSERLAWDADAVTVAHLSSHAIRIRALPGARGGSRLRITVDAGLHEGASATAQATALVFRRSGKIARLPLHLARGGSDTRFVSFRRTRVRRVAILLTNSSTRYACARQTQFACNGEPEDEPQRLAVSVRVVR